MKNLKKPHNPFIRHCHDCNEIYKPTGKYQKFCEKCKIKRRRVATLKMRKEREFLIIK